jgi:phospholipid/cholesterol/gamma-HCH transport system substrate-binding protein
MRRLAIIFLALASAAVIAIVGTGAKDSGSSPYKVRAIFDSAFSVIQGEDVKVAGVKVGKIDGLEVTPDNKAAVVLEIDKAGFDDFRRDATCQIRPQSLIGEKFVECTPTQPRPAGTPEPPPLRVVPQGRPGAGQHLLPVTNTLHTVDLDLLNNIMRLPIRERFSIVLSELGTGLAGNGQSLNQVIRRADPALKETDKVINILASQNKVLAKLARDGDTVLAPLAQRRAQVADFIVRAGDVNQATADRRADLERTFQRLPKFLSELRPTMVRLGAFADQASPVTEDLGAEAPALTRLAKALTPFAKQSIPSIRSLGQAADVGKVAIPKTLPITKDVRALAGEAKPLASNAKTLLQSFRDTGGIERLLDYIFFQGAAINGFDSVGHYLRAALIVNTCTGYTATPVPGCGSTFNQDSTSTRAHAASTSTGDPALNRMNRILNLIAGGTKPAAAAREVLGTKKAAPKHATRRAARAHRTSRRSRRPTEAKTAAPLALPQSVLPGAPEGEGAQAPAPQPTSSAQQPSGPAGTLLDYLLGGSN